MTYLLDTHAFYWAVDPRFDVPAHVRTALSGERLFVSAASAFELATKQRIGKFHAPELLPRWQSALDGLAASELPVSTDQALLGGQMDWPHRDPFDRLIAAQALVDDLTLVTADPVFTTLTDLRLLRW